MDAEDNTVDDDRVGTVQSIVRAFGLLDVLTAGEDGLTLKEVAQATGLARSTAHRLLTTMDALRYVEFDPATSRWMVGLKAFALGTAFIQRRDLGRLGRPIMRSLMLEANETVNISISDEEGIRYVGQVRPVRTPPCAAESGSTLPMHTSAAGKVLLAHWDDMSLTDFLRTQNLKRRTGTSIVDREVLIAELQKVRERGYAIDDQESAMGMRCIAAPVFDNNKQVRASLSISGSIVRLPDQRIESLGRALATASWRMTSKIGAVLAA